MLKKIIGNMTKPEPLYKQEVGDEVEFWTQSGYIYNSWEKYLVTVMKLQPKKYLYSYVKVEQNFFGVWKEQTQWLETNTLLEEI